VVLPVLIWLQMDRTLPGVGIYLGCVSEPSKG
jgi:hypothetical protein